MTTTGVFLTDTEKTATPIGEHATEPVADGVD
jgi:hypothetical protein